MSGVTKNRAGIGVGVAVRYLRTSAGVTAPKILWCLLCRLLPRKEAEMSYGNSWNCPECDHHEESAGRDGMRDAVDEHMTEFHAKVSCG